MSTDNNIFGNTPTFYFFEKELDSGGIDMLIRKRVAKPYPIFSSTELAIAPVGEEWAEGQCRINHLMEFIKQDGQFLLHHQPPSYESLDIGTGRGVDFVVDVREQYSDAPVLSFYDMDRTMFFGLKVWKAFYGMNPGLSAFCERTTDEAHIHKTSTKHLTSNYAHSLGRLIKEIFAELKHVVSTIDDDVFVFRMQALIEAGESSVEAQPTDLNHSSTQGRSGVVSYELFFRCHTLFHYMKLDGQREAVMYACGAAIVQLIQNAIKHADENVKLINSPQGVSFRGTHDTSTTGSEICN